MRKFVTAFALAIAAFAMLPAAHAQVKIGIVDMNKVFTEYYKTIEAEKKLNDAREAAKNEFDTRMEALQKRMEEINKLNADVEKPELSGEKKGTLMSQRDEMVNEARNLDREIAEFRGTRERQLQEQFVRMRKDIVEDILKVVDNKVKSEDYDLVLDSSGLSVGQIPVVLYSRTDMDFSQAIIETLNKDKPAAPAAASQ